MSFYKVYETSHFKKKLTKFSQEFQKYISKYKEQLIVNPYVGKPLGMHWFREKKLGKYRIYYTIYSDLRVVFILVLSTKKDQQEIINILKKSFPHLRKELEKLI
jgi:mRNA-degrading endonuclease RelE of RelBE toxin-antitoxin system